MKTKTEKRAQGSTSFYGITLGTVVDVNDPQQQGRIRVVCPALGDSMDSKISNIVWASYISPFGGITTSGTRGPEEAVSEGATSYGMWAIPKVGSYAVVMCLDGQTSQRVWFGCLQGQFFSHTMPSGRYLDNETNGPLTSTEQPLEPLYSNMRTAFGDISNTHEGKTRGFDNQVSAVDGEVLSKVISGQADDKDDDAGTRKGYQHSRQRPDIIFPKTKGNFDSQVYSITTPGMHSFSMDDSLHNGRIRIRSTSGNQIILDDTNERIYVSTSSGKNWIEMDKNGNIDMYSERRISMHAESGINFKTNGNFIVEAGEIHLNAGLDMRLTSNDSFSIQAVGDFNLQATTTLNLSSLVDVNIQSGALLNLKSTGVLTIGGASLQLQPLGAPGTVPGITGTADFAYAVDRSPEHEPWGRSMSINNDMDTSFNTSSTLELTYDSADNGKVELGESIPRNNFWRR